MNSKIVLFIVVLFFITISAKKSRRNAEKVKIHKIPIDIDNTCTLTGDECTSNRECCSGNCPLQWGTRFCYECKSLGKSCLEDMACCSNNCGWSWLGRVCKR